MLLADANVQRMMPSVIVNTDRYFLNLYFRLNTIILKIIFAIKEPWYLRRKTHIIRT